MYNSINFLYTGFVLIYTEDKFHTFFYILIMETIILIWK